VSVSAELQRVLDTTGRLEDQALPFQPGDTPLVLDRPESRLTGLAGSVHHPGTLAYVGFRRGLVDDSHYVPGGFRTRGDTHLLVDGGFNLGPIDQQPGPTRGWSSQSRFRIRFQGQSHGPEGWVQRKAGGDYHHTFLFGMHGHGNGWQPSPWCLLWTLPPNSWDLTLTLILKTADGDVNFLRIPADPLNDHLDLDLAVDLTVGGALAVVNGHAVPATFDHPVTNSHLANNYDYPFAVGAFEWGVNSTDRQAPVLDFTTRVLSYHGDHGFEFYLYPHLSRPATYNGGPSLPLVRAGGSTSTRWAQAIHCTQGEPNQAVGDIRIRDLRIDGKDGNPVIVVRCLSSPLWIDDVKCDGGSCFLQMMSPGGSIYPVTVNRCHLSGQYDVSVMAHLADLTVRDSVLGRALNGAAFVRGGTADFHNVFVGEAGGPPPFLFRQSGGVGNYFKVHTNYEGSRPPCMVDLYPQGWDGMRATEAYVRLCNKDLVTDFVRVHSRPDNYTAAVRVDVDDVSVTR
jgi:hypothetical protein